MSWCRCGSRVARWVSSEYSNVGCLAHAEHSHSVVCLSVGTLAASREQQRSHGWAIPVLTHGWVGTKSAAAWVGQEYSGGGRRACESASWRKEESSSCASADGCMRRRCRRRASAMPKRATAGARRSAGRTNEQTNEQANEQTNKQTNNHVDERRGEPSTGAGVNYCRCGRGEPRPGAHAAAGAEEEYSNLGRRTESTASTASPYHGARAACLQLVREEGDVVEAQAAVAVDVGGFKYLQWRYEYAPCSARQGRVRGFTHETFVDRCHAAYSGYPLTPSAAGGNARCGATRGA